MAASGDNIRACRSSCNGRVHVENGLSDGPLFVRVDTIRAEATRACCAIARAMCDLLKSDISKDKLGEKIALAAPAEGFTKVPCHTTYQFSVGHAEVKYASAVTHTGDFSCSVLPVECGRSLKISMDEVNIIGMSKDWDINAKVSYKNESWSDTTRMRAAKKTMCEASCSGRVHVNNISDSALFIRVDSCRMEATNACRAVASTVSTLSDIDVVEPRIALAAGGEGFNKVNAQKNCHLFIGHAQVKYVSAFTRTGVFACFAIPVECNRHLKVHEHRLWLN